MAGFLAAILRPTVVGRGDLEGGITSHPLPPRMNPGYAPALAPRKQEEWHFVMSQGPESDGEEVSATPS